MILTFILMFLQTSFAAPNNAPANKSIANYDPEELLLDILDFNDTIPRAGYGLLNIENHQNPENYGTGEYTHKIKLNDNTDEDAHRLNNNGDSQSVYNHDLPKRRRKRRKPRQHFIGLNYPGLQYNVPGVTPHQYSYSTYNNEQNYAPSFATSLLSSISGALSSISEHDDRECVARLLCEAVSGSPASSLFDRVSGLQPLLTLLTAYSGTQSTPIQVFGKAVLLGASRNKAVCQEVHPLCPTDTEQLVHYLNNHNGGFFRFFNAPERQNIEQYHNQIQQNHHYNQYYGLYNEPYNRFNSPTLYNTGQQYGIAFPHQNDEYDNKIQKRIQNKPLQEYESLNTQTHKWTFPDIENKYDESTLKFPQLESNYRKTRGFSFPDNNNISNERFVYNGYNPVYNRLSYNNDRELTNNRHSYNNHDVKGYQTVYVVRGDGDPHKPEIIHLRPGQTVT